MEQILLASLDHDLAVGPNDTLNRSERHVIGCSRFCLPFSVVWLFHGFLAGRLPPG